MTAALSDSQLNSFAAVIVTGGSSGIGKSFLEHAVTMYPEALLCNLSRSDPTGKIYPAGGRREFNHVPCNLGDAASVARAAATVLELLGRKAAAGPILFVNNAGFGGYGPFSGLDASHQLGMIDVNLRAVVDLTARLLPALMERGGAVINVASTAAFQPTPHLSTYGATKAFVLHWSLGLAEELRGRGVRVLAVCPGPTRTDFFRRAGLGSGAAPARLGQTSDQVVREAFRALRAGRTLIVTGWRNKLIAAVASKLPKAFAARLAGAILGRARAPRNRRA